MLFNSLQFIVFLAIVYICYLFLSHKWQNRLLIVASLVFYASWNWKFLFVMLGSITTDYVCSKYIYRSRDKSLRKKLLLLSIVVNLGILGFFKYCNFFLENIQPILNLFLPFKSDFFLEVILPLGISFYTFEAISYVTDVYRGVAKPAEKYADYLLFVIYFPHLIAGPIMRAKKFLPQISSPRILTWEQFHEGCFLIFWGFFEKTFVADNLARIVNPVFAAPPPYDGAMVLTAVYAFAFQIFCDFDGYSNIARGIGKCMGFDLTINFRLPYFATNPRAFWERWHISLSNWLKDYLYIPLGGNRQSPLMTYRNLFLTMVIGGLWHGASWTFVLWGAFHGIILIIHRLIEPRRIQLPSPRSTSIKNGLSIICALGFFHLVCYGWLLFRAQSFPQIYAMTHALFFGLHLNSIALSKFLKVMLILCPFIIIQIGQFHSNDLLFLYRQYWLVKIFAYAFMTYLIFGWGILQSEEFIYFQF